MRSGFFAAVASCSLLLAAPASARGVKIGILNDQSGVYADYGGKYSAPKGISSRLIAGLSHSRKRLPKK